MRRITQIYADFRCIVYALIFCLFFIGCESVAVYTSANQRDRAGEQETVTGSRESGDERVVATQHADVTSYVPTTQQPTGRNRNNRDGRFEYMVTSWYGNQFHGRQTASGETFNMYEYTAAHRTLPFGTRLRLVNEDNNKEAIVRINDRGPVPLERDLDISFRAAQSLDFVDVGIIRLRVEVLEN